ncbi:transcriptional regulator, AraC family [Polaribacter sp. KT25b]|uniref:helix-turn-helix domain-containing protein n=1 Tax=Polaribacter sp. KT25b TaxID=1855336 RepID=UPI00087A45D3|nr:helix-turn-helix domain-containing protein [Polaribacter sp. KT25b]SDS54274.1 transcriptional regulator, AraC family [Polaribacter sp. KT25b]
MNYISILSVLSILIVTLFLFFSGFLLTVKTDKKLSNRLLAAFLIITAIDISAFFYHNFIQLPLGLEMLRVRISSFKDPLLFLYILSVIYTNFNLKKKHLVHILPWLVHIIVLIPNFFLVDENSKLTFFNNYEQTSEGKFLTIFGRFISASYFIAEIYYVLRYRKLLLENYTDKNAFKNYNWLKQLLILLTIGQIITIVKNNFRSYYSLEATDVLRTITLLFGIFFIFWLVLKALNSPKLFRGIDVNLLTSKEISKVSVVDQKVNEQLKSLKKYMETEKPYLNPSLTIRNLSEEIKMNSRDLSVLINQNLNQHFFDFVNEYRIKDAMEILKNPSKKEFTVLEILYEVGFNSKSSFNTAFKKHTNLTPTQFRKSP